MRFLILATALLLSTPVVCAQVRFTLDVNDTIKSTFLTQANSDTIIDGLNANASNGKQFALRLIPGGGSGSGSGFGTTEYWNGAPAHYSLQGASGQHGLIVHTTGAAGIAIIGESDTGAQALKGVQKQYFTRPTLTLYRYGGTPLLSDAPEFEIYAPAAGSADLLKFYGKNGVNSRIDANGGWRPPHIPDGTAQNDSTYFSTDASKLCYKDSSGVVHPLY